MSKAKTATTSRKATHEGTCQICGAGQKLPAGVLSLHGYTTKWGFFNGICNGAGSLPFEQSKDLIEGAINANEGRILELENESNILKVGTLLPDNKAYFNFYSNGRSSYQIVEFIEISATDYRVRDRDGRTQHVFKMTHGDGRLDMDDVRRAWNHRYAANRLDREIADRKSYIQWQRERIANWKPQALKPIAQ